MEFNITTPGFALSWPDVQFHNREICHNGVVRYWLTRLSSAEDSAELELAGGSDNNTLAAIRRAQTPLAAVLVDHLTIPINYDIPDDTAPTIMRVCSWRHFIPEPTSLVLLVGRARPPLYGAPPCK